MPGSNPLTLDEIDSMLATAWRIRDRALILMICGCGTRANETRLIKVSDVMRADRTMTGKLQIPRANAKGKRRARTRDIPPRTMQGLLLWLAKHPAPHLNAPLWPSRENPEEPITTRTIQRIFNAAAKDLEPDRKITPHSGRKFFGTQIYARTGNDIAQAARALGQTNPTSTLHYLDLGDDGLRAATMEVFNDAAYPQLAFPSTENSPSI
jgi:integrase